MESLERIRQHVLDEAREEASALLAKAEEETKAFLQTEQAGAEARYEEALQEIRDQQQKKRAQLRADLSMQERRALLETKQAWISKVLEAVKQRLQERSPEEKFLAYQDLLQQEEILEARKRYGEPTVEIRLAQAEAGLAPKLQEALPYPTEITATETGFQGGLIAIVGPIHFNYSYEELLRRREEEFIGRIGQKLFS